jgi:hypothetical protein
MEVGSREENGMIQESASSPIVINQGIWIGSPSTDKRITFSSTSNKHIVQTQQYQDILDGGSINQVRHRAKKDQYKTERVQDENGWVGSPSTYKQITYSATTNRHIANTQYIPEYVPEIVPPPKARPADSWDRPIFLGRTNSRTNSPGGSARNRRGKGKRRQAASEHRRGEAKRAEIQRRESNWVGSPSTYKDITFSSTSNRHIINTQDLPQFVL